MDIILGHDDTNKINMDIIGYLGSIFSSGVFGEEADLKYTL